MNNNKILEQLNSNEKSISQLSKSFTFFEFIEKNNIQILVVHGLKTSTHTHRYIHKAIFDTFVFLTKNNNSIKVIWCDDLPNDYIYSDEIKYLIFSSPHYETDKYLPIKNNMYYILHYNIHNAFTNKIIDRYDNLLKSNRAVKYVEFRFIPKDEINIKFLNDSKTEWYDSNDNSVHMPWATNIFPEEINNNIKKISLPQFKKENGLVFIGSIWHKNEEIMKNTKYICDKLNINYIHKKITNESEHSKIIREAYIAPAIQGEGHCISETNFYIPCRIFKNISFGALPITNNKGVYNLFCKFLIIYDSDINNLIIKSIKKQNDNYDNYDIYKHELIKVMIYVRDNHTYINRLNTLVQFLQ